MKGVNSISNKPVGRRPGVHDTKEKIITAARTLFADKGFDRTSIRHIAALADVDPALVMHYFGTKQQLFMESMLPLFEGPRLLPNAMQGDITTIGNRLATFFVTMISEQATQNLILGLFRSISSEERAAVMAREFIQGGIIEHVEPFLPGPNKKLQANLLGAQLVGIFVARLIIKAEPIASSSPEELITYLAPRLQSHFE